MDAPKAGSRSIAAGALARLASISALAVLAWRDGFWALGVDTLNLPVLAVSGVLLCAGALLVRYSRHGRPGARLALLVVSAGSAWSVPAVLFVDLALVAFAVTEPDSICHDVPCRDHVPLIVLLVLAAPASVADALLSTTGAVRVCRRLPAGASRRAGWTVLTVGALLIAVGVLIAAYRW
jgi:hypothetical protein